MIRNERKVVVMFSTIVNRYYTPLRCTKIHTPQRSMKRNKLYSIVCRMREKDCGCDINHEYVHNDNSDTHEAENERLEALLCTALVLPCIKE